MFARTGRVERAKELRDLQRAGTSVGALDRIARFEAELLDGDIAAAEGRYNDLLAHIRVACGSYRPTGMAICDAAPVTADAYDRIGQADSAVAICERYIAFQGDPQELDMEWLARSLRRLAELHEERGNREAAAEYYARFVELWQDADPQFQPLVRNARDPLIALASEQRR